MIKMVVELKDLKIKKVKNVFGYCRGVCERCKRCGEKEKRWRIVVREINGKMLWGLECDVKKLRVYC